MHQELISILVNKTKDSRLVLAPGSKLHSVTSADCDRVLRGVLRESQYADNAAAAGLAASSAFTEAMLQTSLELVCSSPLL